VSRATTRGIGAERPRDEARVAARNVSTRYLALIVGLLVLPTSGTLAVMVYALTFLCFGVGPAERRFCIPEVLTLSSRPPLVATARERA
jgi:hypothetical protein